MKSLIYGYGITGKSIERYLIKNNIDYKKTSIFIFSFLVLFTCGTFKNGNSSQIINSLNIAVIQPNLDPKEKWNQSIK